MLEKMTKLNKINKKLEFIWTQK